MANVFNPPCDRAAIESRPADAPCLKQAGPWVLAATILGSSMVFIDGTVVNVALPVLQKEFDTGLAGTQWVMEAYSLVLAALILVGGSLGDRLGRRRMFVTGITVFALASAGCGLSQSVAQLIATRALQGAGGALMTPESLAIISASFADKERGRAIGTWSAFTSLASAVGPVVGGWLISVGSWRYAFVLNVPVAVLTLILTSRVPESRDPRASGRLDWAGASLATVALGAIVYGFVSASAVGFGHPDVIVSLAAGIVTAVAFVAIEARKAEPMLPLQLFRSRAFSGANVFTLFLYAGLGGALFFLPFNLVQVHGYSTQAAGAALLPFVLLMFLLSRWSGGLVPRFGARLPLVIGPLLAAGGYALFALPGTEGGYWTTYFPAVVVLGLGMAVSVAPLSATVMDAVSSSHASLASGINNAVSRTAGVLALAILGIFVVFAFGRSLAGRLKTLQLPSQVQQAVLDQRGKLAAIELPPGLDGATAANLQAAINAAFVDGFRVAMLIAAGLALAASLCAALTMAPRQQPSP